MPRTNSPHLPIDLQRSRLSRSPVLIVICPDLHGIIGRDLADGDKNGGAAALGIA